MSLYAYLNGEEVQITGYFRHPEKGFNAEIFSTQTGTRKSVSIWDLTHNTEEDAKKVFHRLLGLTINKAQTIDREKGVPSDALQIKLQEAEAIETAIIEA